MPNVSPEEVSRLAGLARIRLGDGEPERLAKDLADILEHVAAIEAAESAPPSSAAAERSVFRSDDAETRIGVGTAQQEFPETDGSFLKVPRVF